MYKNKTCDLVQKMFFTGTQIWAAVHETIDLFQRISEIYEMQIIFRASDLGVRVVTSERLVWVRE